MSGSSVDFLIIGSGIAGLRAALELGGADVLVLTKSDPRAGSTDYAQGGIAAAVAPDDSLEAHAADTLRAGAGLCDPQAVAVLVEDGRACVQELVAWGAAFDRAADGSLDLAREGAHSVRRVLHARDATGREIGRALAARARALGVVVRDHTTVVGLLVEGDRAVGARVLDPDGRGEDVRARMTLIATGGAGQVYRETTNPPVATGDGIALAYLAGARVVDLEFVQFHPTALAVPDAPRYLLSEALRGEGARLVNIHGEAFMPRYEPEGDLAPRDRVARAIVRESTRTGGPVYLTLAHLPPDLVRSRFPLITALCKRVGLDLATDRLPVGPAAHYLMGGVATDLDGRTSLAGLWAAGEAACTGVHGANRLASNSLLEGLTFGKRAGATMRSWSGDSWSQEFRKAPSLPFEGPAVPRSDGSTLSAVDVASILWRDVGVFRTAAGLGAASAALEGAWHDVQARLADGPSLTAEEWRRACLVTVARLIARAATRREESRGAHWRDDFPETDDLHWKRRVYEEHRQVKS